MGCPVRKLWQSRTPSAAMAMGHQGWRERARPGSISSISHQKRHCADALRNNPLYETADLYQSGVTHRVDVRHLPLPDATYDVVIANHVLEHIDDDRQAMAELYRVLRPKGVALLTVPINPTRATTYEDPAIIDPVRRQAHFNAPDHRRFYGLDFADRLKAVGFAVETFRVTPAEEVRFGLLPMEWLYIATRPGPDP